jgi:hypothetical protein
VIDLLDWRWIFFLMVPMGVLGVRPDGAARP